MFVTAAPDPYYMPELDNGVAAYGWRNASGRSPLSRSVLSGTIKTVIIGGQSNHATACGSGTYSTVSSNAMQLNPYDGGLYAGVDPVLGCSYDGSSNVSSLVMRFADRIIVNHSTWKVVAVPIAIGGSAFAKWEPTADLPFKLWHRIKAAILRVRALGLEPTDFIWGEGETDNALATSAGSITASINAIVDGIRALSCTAPFWVGKFTLNGGSTSASVQTGIANAIDPVTRIIKAGYDADTNATVAGGFRLGDQTHLSNTGLTLVANGWADLLYP